MHSWFPEVCECSILLMHLLNWQPKAAYPQGKRGKPGKQGLPGLKGYQVSWLLCWQNVYHTQFRLYYGKWKSIVYLTFQGVTGDSGYDGVLGRDGHRGKRGLQGARGFRGGDGAEVNWYLLDQSQLEEGHLDCPKYRDNKFSDRFVFFAVYFFHYCWFSLKYFEIVGIFPLSIIGLQVQRAWSGLIQEQWIIQIR